MNLQGQKFGQLLVLNPSEIQDTNYYKWDCLCDCGNHCTKETRYLTRKGKPEIKHCGCKPFVNNGPTTDLTGKVFERLTVMSFDRKEGNKKYWNTICSCGTNYKVREDALLSSTRPTRSCGCLQKEIVTTAQGKYSKENNSGLTQRQIILGNKIRSDIKYNLVGKVFGKLIMLPTDGVNNSTKLWDCLCSCGNNHQVKAVNLLRTTNPTKSCGCSRIQAAHRLTNTPEFRTWTGIKERCLNSNNENYKHYGERGIVVCQHWLESFENFIEDMGNKPTTTSTIERVNVNGNYEPSNCIWLEGNLQQRNQTNTILNKDKVKEIKSLKLQGLNVPTIFRQLIIKYPNITKASINNVFYGLTWKDIV
jgi:uncharacterized protein (DUF1330 family)